MISQSRLCLAGVLLLFASSFAQATFVPISVYPNPANFGTVAQSSSGYLTLYVSNVTANSVVVSSMSISGANSADFAFYGNNCVGTLAFGQTCEMTMLFTPSALGSRTANSLIGVQGLSQQVTITLDGTGGNPFPILTSLSPSTAYVNSAGFTLTVNGSGFVSGAVVYWNNIALTTSYVSSTQLTAQVPASEISKLEQAVRAAQLGVPRIHIIDGRVEEGLLAEVFSNEGIGTLIHVNEYQAIRRAQKKDARSIFALLQPVMKTDELLRRTRAEIERQIADYFVLEIDRNPVACAALHLYPDEDKAELASVCVDAI